MDVGPDLPPTSFPAAVAALRRAAAAHFYAASDALPERGDSGDDAGDDARSEGDDDEGGTRWWRDASDVLEAYAAAVSPAGGATTTAHASRLPAAAEALLHEHAVSFTTSLALGDALAVLDIDCVGRFRAWGAPGSPQAVAVAEIAEIKTSSAGRRAAAKQLADRFRVLALVYDAVHAPRAAPRLRAVGTVYAPSLAVGGAGGGGVFECLEVSYRPPGGDGARTARVDLEVRFVPLAV